MNATEYKATRKRLGMTQAALAVALNVSRKAVNAREAGGTITREAAMAISFLVITTPAQQQSERHERSIKQLPEGAPPPKAKPPFNPETEPTPTPCRK